MTSFVFLNASMFILKYPLIFVISMCVYIYIYIYELACFFPILQYYTLVLFDIKSKIKAS